MAKGPPDSVEPDQRTESIDILRGVALFGVLAANLVMEFRVSLFQQFVPDAGFHPMPDRAAEAFIRHALELKAYALFSFLFGVGLAIQYQRFSRGDRPFYWLVRRLAILLCLGLAHLLLIWNGDILTQYAIAGLIVLPLLAAQTRVIAILCVALLAVYSSVSLLPLPVTWPDAASIQQHVAEASRVYPTGDFLEIRRFSARELPYLLPLHVFIFPRTLALFLLGILAWRAGVLSEPRAHRRILLTTAMGGLAAGAMLTALDATAAEATWQAVGPLRFIIPAAGPIVLALGYGALIICAVEFSSKGRRFLRAFAPIGRTAFTNYVLQSLIFGWIFFGYGLGQFGRMGAAAALGLGIMVFAFQMGLSKWWLRRFRFGPLEWLWRSLMYGKAQPLVLGRTIR